MRLTERDYGLFKSLYDYRYLSIDQLRRLHFSSQQTLNRRVRVLIDGQYISDFKLTGTDERLVALSHRGATVVAEHIGVPVEELSWSRKRAKPKDYLFLKHFLLVNDLRIALAKSCDLHHNVRLVDFIPEYRGQNTEHGRQKHLRDTIADNVGSQNTHTPDGVFALEKEGSTALFFLEADRGTEVVSNPNLGFLKMIGFYLNYFKSGGWHRYKSDFAVPGNFSSFRTLIVTTTEARLKNMCEAGRSFAFSRQDLKCVIWLAAADSIEDETLLTTKWLTLGDEKSYSIL